MREWYDTVDLTLFMAMFRTMRGWLCNLGHGTTKQVYSSVFLCEAYIEKKQHHYRRNVHSMADSASALLVSSFAIPDVGRCLRPIRTLRIITRNTQLKPEGYYTQKPYITRVSETNHNLATAIHVLH